ncbi:tetratricopeptide repeat protein [Agromyces sp. MMS24-K17]|uniref:tetratricopeptide repeat protein n=1 Tax=Agromyces sp. MMS24-K17 TaxID=3372850 RepID=UPI00375483C9
MAATTDPRSWQDRIDETWASADAIDPAELVRRIDALADELPDDDPRGPFERGGARDSTGDEAGAEAWYRRALDLGLGGRPRVELHVQLASTVRNLGRPRESVELLDAVLPDAGDLRDAVIAFRALALVDLGETRAAASDALAALAAHLPQYGRSLRAYAADLRPEGAEGAAGDAASA